MEIDLRKSLEMAFGHLNRFSVPGIGTFKKSYYRSEIDHRDKMVLPPQEIFELTKEGARLDASKEIEVLVNFFFQQFKTTLEIARDAVRDLGDLIREEISNYDSYVILGIGEIRQNEVGEIVLLPQKDREQATGNDFFGLAPIKYTLGMAGAETVPPPPVTKTKTEPEQAEAPIRLTKESKPTVNEKAASPPVVPLVQTPAPEKEAVSVPAKPEKVVESSTTQPPAKKLGETPPPEDSQPKKKKKVWKILLALTLIWGLIFACIWFRSELFEFGKGLFDSGSSEVVTDGDTDSGTDVDTNLGTDTDLDTDTDLATDTDTDTDVDSGTDTDLDTDSDLDTDTDVDANVDTDVDTDFSSEIDFEGEFGEAPVPGQHYLIVGSSKNGRFAEKDARKYQKGAYKGKAVAPRMNGGYYKVSIYNSTDKMEVIQKMVEWKDTFKEGTWIYSPK